MSIADVTFTWIGATSNFHLIIHRWEILAFLQILVSPEKNKRIMLNIKQESHDAQIYDGFCNQGEGANIW